MWLWQQEMKLTLAKAQFIIFLALLGVSLSINDRDYAFFFALLLTSSAAILTESGFAYLENHKFSISESAIISGLIIGFVLASGNHWWVNILASVFAISSKRLIRINKKHLFNPAGFGIFLSTILLGANTQWKGTYLWYIFIPAGVYFAFKFRKLELVAGYLATALALFGLQAMLQNSGLGNIFGYLSYFYIFVMIIEPKTTPVRSRGKLIFGIALACLIFIFVQVGVKFDAELAALLTLNLFVPLLNKMPRKEPV